MPSSVARMLRSNSSSRRATIRSSLSGMAVIAMREARRRRPDAGTLREAARRRAPRRARTTTLDDGFVRSRTRPSRTLGRLEAGDDRRRLPLTDRLVMVAAHEPGGQPRAVVEPRRAENSLENRAGSSMSVTSCPHPIDRRVHQRRRPRPSGCRRTSWRHPAAPAGSRSSSAIPTRGAGTRSAAHG